jgi:hypothetical protein
MQMPREAKLNMATEQDEINLKAVNALINQIKPFLDNPAEDKRISLEMYGDWAEVSTRTYETIWKSGENVLAAVQDELMQQTAIVMKADSRDSHGGFSTAETVMKACQSYNAMGDGASGVQHALAVDADTIRMVESYIAPSDFSLTDAAGVEMVAVKKGDWVATAQYNNEFFWNMAKNGDLDSFSIEADGIVTYDE